MHMPERDEARRDRNVPELERGGTKTSNGTTVRLLVLNFQTKPSVKPVSIRNSFAIILTFF